MEQCISRGLAPSHPIQTVSHLNSHLLRAKGEGAGGNPPSLQPRGPRVGAEGFEVVSLCGQCLQPMYIPDLLSGHPVELNADCSVVQL